MVEAFLTPPFQILDFIDKELVRLDQGLVSVPGPWFSMKGMVHLSVNWFSMKGLVPGLV